MNHHPTMQEKRVLLNHIADLEHHLFQAKTRLNVPLSKLQSVTQMLAPEFRHQQVSYFYTNINHYDLVVFKMEIRKES